MGRLGHHPKGRTKLLSLINPKRNIRIPYIHNQDHSFPSFPYIMDPRLMIAICRSPNKLISPVNAHYIMNLRFMIAIHRSPNE